MERGTSLGFIVELFQGHPVRIFVAGAPDVGERDVLLRVASLVDNLETVAGEVSAHVVEIAVSTVDERGGVAVGSQYSTG